MKPLRVDTKLKLEALVVRLNDQNKRFAKLVEVGEAPAANAAPAPAAPSAATPAAAPKGTPASPSEPTEQPVEGDDVVNVNAIVDQLNAIRGGQSFKEQKVMAELKRYFEGLDEGEQDALHAYLKGLAQIVSGQVDAGSAEEPSDHGVATKTTGKVTRTIKPSVTRKPANPANAAVQAAPIQRTAPPSKEDTSAPAPIVPKKR